MLALCWTDVDVSKRELHVLQQLTTKRGRPVLKQLKTQPSERIVTFGAATAAVIEAHREKQPAEAEFAGAAWKDQALVFTTALGGWADPNKFGRLMESLVERAGVPRVTPKGPRHTAQSIGRVVCATTR